MSKSSKKSDSLFESDILKSKAPKKNELLEYLENLHRDLSALEQDIQYAPKGLHATATQLVQSKYMENSDRDIRILVTCCIVDVLRIYAPEAPYKDEDMIRVFEAIAKQILSLQTTDVSSPAGKRILYILTSISTVKSCLVPVLLDQKGVRSASEVVEEMFSAVTSIVDSSSTEEVFTSVCEILQSCIEEYNNISPELLEILLVAILPAQKAENPMLYRVVATVLHTVSPIIMGTLTSIMSSILVGPGNQFQGKLSEIADDVYAIIYELHIISPALMQGILPSLTAQLRSEDDSTRAKVVQLLGKVYLTENSSYHEDFPRYFRDFIGRMGDSLVSIRNEMIEFSCLLMARGVEVKYISEILSHRLRDPEEEVRKKAVTKLFRQVFDNIEMSDSLLLSALFDRVKDKVVDIRKAAMIGMSKLYWKYVSSRLPPLSEFEFTDLVSVKEQIPSSVLDKLQMVPGTLLKCWGYPDVETRHVTLQLTQEYLLPKQLFGGQAGEINSIRLSAMLLMYALLGYEERPFFEAILTFKARINSYVLSLLSLKKGGRESYGSTSNANGNSNDQRTISQLKQLLSKLSLLLPTAENKKTGFFDKLLTTKDKSVWKLLEHATETNWAIEENAKFKDDLVKKLDSKSPLAEFIAMVYDMASYQLVTSPMVDALLRGVLDSKFVSNAGIPEVLSMLSKHCPKLFSNTSLVLREWMDSTLLKNDDKGKKRQVKLEYFEHGIDVINHVAPFLAETEEVEKLGRALLDGMRDGSDETTITLAGSALRSILSSQESLSSRFLRDVVKYIKDITSVSATAKSFTMLMISISSLLELSPRLMDKKDTKVLAMQTMYAIFSNNTRNQLVQHLRNELSESMPAELSVEVCATMMRLFTRLAIFEDTAEEVKLEEGFEFLVDINRVIDFNELVGSLFECMENKGKRFQSFESASEDDAMMLYRQASLCAMSMIATAGFATISTERWHELGFSLLHEDRDFQVALLSELNDIIKVQQVPLRFLAYPCLLVHDAHIAKLAREGLTVAITRLRRTHEDVASKLVTVNDANERLMLQQQAAETMPENIMPYLLHILTYHPDFPTSVAATTPEDKARIKLVVSCIRLLVQVLQSKLKVPTSNLPFLFKQLNTINHRFVDRLDPNNVGLHFVTHLTVRLLQEQVKTAENLHVYPGEVFLPRDLYEGIEAGKAQIQLGMIATGGRTDVPNMLDMAEFAIDQVMQVATKGRDKTGTTTNTSPPFKARSGFGTGAGRGVSPERKRAAAKAKANRVNDQDEDDDEEDKPRKKAKATKQLPPEQPSRSLPSRGAKANVTSYVEPEEMTDRDMDRLNRDAEKKRKSSESTGRQSSLSPSKRMRVSSSSFGADTSNAANLNNSSSFLSTSFASTTTGRPSLKSVAAAATKQSESADEFYDLFASQTSGHDKEKPRESIAKNVSKSASTDPEESNISTTENNTESPAVLTSRSVRQANRVLSERNSNIQQSAATSTNKPSTSKAKEITTSSNDDEDSSLIFAAASKSKTRGRANQEEPTVAKATGKRTRQQIRA